jgi:RNA polymerase sigma factor (sigma-70 family)
MEALPDIKTAYTQYRPLFCDALARLARRGLVWPFQDFEDLRHDFFAYAWQGLTEHYDPTRGSAAGYVYGAFLRFARQRILQSQSMRPLVQDLADLAEQVAEQARLSPLESVVRGEEMELLQEALGELPAELRALLLEFFALGPRSRRRLARKYGMSRHRVDELLLNGFGQLAVRLGARGPWPLPDWEVAFALWGEGRKVEETAARLGQPVEKVRALREHFKKLLAGVLWSRYGGAGSAWPPAEVPESSPP